MKTGIRQVFSNTLAKTAGALNRMADKAKPNTPTSPAKPFSETTMAQQSNSFKTGQTTNSSQSTASEQKSRITSAYPSNTNSYASTLIVDGNSDNANTRDVTELDRIELEKISDIVGVLKEYLSVGQPGKEIPPIALDRITHNARYLYWLGYRSRESIVTLINEAILTGEIKAFQSNSLERANTNQSKPAVINQTNSPKLTSPPASTQRPLGSGSITKPDGINDNKRPGLHARRPR
jgi:hypothetical protein